MQAFWSRSLFMAVPEMPEAMVHDILLSSREAVLNALRHGCGGRADTTAKFQIAYCAASQMVRVRVSDPGPGHQFDFSRAEAHDLPDRHRGLFLIQHLASRVESKHGGATLIMDFAWP
jgi:anti-sigma regulatory factor (Ser/Thr protein kinase)